MKPFNENLPQKCKNYKFLYKNAKNIAIGLFYLFEILLIFKKNIGNHKDLIAIYFSDQLDMSSITCSPSAIFGH